MRKLVYYIGMTIDGFIAGPENETDFFPVSPDVVEFIVRDYPDTLPTHIRQQLGADAPNQHFDVCIMGRATYDPALAVGVTSPYAHLRQYVVSQSIETSPDPAITLLTGNGLLDTVRALKAEDGADIYLVGGGHLAGALLPEIDSLVIKLYPVVAGAGIPLFTAEFSPTAFTLRENRTLPSGTLVLHYDKQ